MEEVELEIPQEDSPQAAKTPVAANNANQNEEAPRNMIAEWTITILLLLFGTTTLVQAFVIPTGSMEDTLLVGDHLLVDKLAYAPAGELSKFFLPYSPIQRGDIIVFRWPSDIKLTFVKRVIGIPGDHIRLEDKALYRNGKKITEPYKYHKNDSYDSYRDNFPSSPNANVEGGALEMLQSHVVGREIVVPENCYFALGDNRDYSLDSRYWGFVPRQNIIGKPLIIYWSYETTTEMLSSPSISVEHLKDLAFNFFRKTRWQRSFQLIRGFPSPE